MKRLLFFFVSVFLTANGYGQSLNLNNLTSLNLPLGVSTINSTNAKAFIANNIDKSLVPTIDGGDRTTYLKADNIIFQFTTTHRPIKTGQLLYLKKSFDITNKRFSAYGSVIEKFNGYDILLIKHSYNANVTDFFCFSKNNDKAISGSVWYRSQDEVQANLLLETILASIKFAGE